MGNILIENGKEVGALSGPTSASNCMLSDGVTSVESALTYSETEHVVGKWIDGSNIYEKTVNFGALPNTTTKSVDAGISNLKRLIDIRGYAYNGSTCLMIPRLAISNENAQITLDLYSGNIQIQTGVDRSAYTECYITLRYTKSA